MKLSIQEQEIYQAIIRLAHSIHYAQKALSPIQTGNFQEVIHKFINSLEEQHQDFKEDAEYHKSHGLNQAYQDAFKVLAKNKITLNRVLIRELLYLLEKVSQVLGIPEEERLTVDQLEKDILKLYKNRHEDDNLKMSAELSSLYSTIGQLAYVIAMADHVMMPEEKDAFKKVIKANLGNFDWLAEDRFNVVEELMKNDLESTYEHAIYLIERNRAALSEKTIQKFLNVMTEVAIVAGITQEERDYMRRFKKDIHNIYYGEQS